MKLFYLRSSSPLNSLIVLALSGFCISNKSFAFDDFDDEFAESPRTFVTPARMTSSHLDSPNSISRFEIEDLNYLGIDNVADVMRLTPGMIVSDVHGSESLIGYHGSNVNVPRRLEILFNSNSLYRPGYSGIHWHRLPFAMEDLSAIEVVRGSNVVDFGANALTGTVNFIQTPLVLQPEYLASGRTGSGGQHSAYLLGHKSIDSGHYSLRYFHNQTDGFDQAGDDDSSSDDMKQNGLGFIGEVDLTDGLILDWNLGVSETTYNVSGFNSLELESSSLDEAFDSFDEAGSPEETHVSLITKLSGSFGDTNRNNWSVGTNFIHYDRKQPIRLCAPTFMFDPSLEELDGSPNIMLVPEDIPLALTSGISTGVVELDQSILSPLTTEQQALLAEMGGRLQDAGLLAAVEEICGSTDQDVKENRFGLFADFSTSVDRHYAFSSNVSLNHSTAESQTYLNGEASRTSYGWSNNIRYYIYDNLVANAGAMIEGNDSVREIYTSRRTSLNWEAFDSNIFRFTYSLSKRSPDIYELERDWNYELAFDEGVTDYLGNPKATIFRNAVSPESLDAETIETFELGYTFVDRSNRHYFDIKYFEENLSDLISEPFSYLDFRLTNNGRLDLKGAEMAYQFTSREISGLKYGFSYTYLDNDTETRFEDSLYSESFGNTWMIYPLRDDLYLGLGAYYYKDLAERDYFRQDLTLTKHYHLKNSDITVRFNYRRVPEAIHSYTELSSIEPNIVSYNDQNRYTLTAQIAY